MREIIPRMYDNKVWFLNWERSVNIAVDKKIISCVLDKLNEFTVAISWSSQEKDILQLHKKDSA